MEWLNKLTYDRRLKSSFIIYMLIFLILGLTFTKIIEILIENYLVKMQSLYLIENLVEEGGEIFTYFQLNSERPTHLNKSLVNILELYRGFALTINLLIFSILGLLLYFKDKLKETIDELKNLQIRDKSLLVNENGVYGDEMLQLSYNYNQMILSLKVEKKRIWKEVEEMEQMMASFEHDIRTPITIIRGYNDMILKYYPEGKMSDEKLEKTLSNIGVQVNRLDEYIKRMGSLKSIQELELNIKSIETKKLLSNMEKIGEALLKGKDFKINNKLQSKFLYLDENIVLEVYENIITNGLRYAKSIIEVNIDEDEKDLIIQVQDDGEGFSKEALRYGTVAFFSENKSNGENIGLGLNISKELCEKHMGKINLSNNIIGGLVEMKIKKTNDIL